MRSLIKIKLMLLPYYINSSNEYTLTFYIKKILFLILKCWVESTTRAKSAFKLLHLKAAK